MADHIALLLAIAAYLHTVEISLTLKLGNVFHKHFLLYWLYSILATIEVV